VVVTAIGLGLFAYSGIGGNQRAGFLFLQDIEQRTLDLRFALRGKRAADPRIVIVGIDDKTLQTIGSYPLPRSNYALLVRELKKSGASVVGFDVTFPTAASSEALDILARLRSEIGSSAPKDLQNKVLQLEQQSDVDAQFAAALKDAGRFRSQPGMDSGGRAGGRWSRSQPSKTGRSRRILWFLQHHS
jgi:hypothetical protein